MPIERAQRSDAEAVLALYERALPPFGETLEHVLDTFEESTTLIQRRDGKIVGTVRGEVRDGVVRVKRLAVDPELQGSGIGSRLLAALETWFADVTAFESLTEQSEADVGLYERCGYREVRRERESDGIVRVTLRKDVQS